MATEVIHTVSAPGGGGYYTSLASWEAAQNRDLATADEIAVVEIIGNISSGSVQYAGWVTDSTHYILIRPVAGNEYKLDANTGCVVTFSGNYGFDQQGSIIHVEKIKLNHSAGFFPFTGEIHLNNVSLLSKYYINSSASSTFNTCLIDSGFYTETGAGGHYLRYVTLKNCTVIADSSYGIILEDCTATNTIVYNKYATPTYTSFWSSDGGDYNASNDASSPGANSIDNITSSEFNDFINSDYHLAASSQLRGAGTNLYSSFTTDIDGDEWPSSGAWDIGFDYYVAAGSSNSVDFNLGEDLQTGLTFSQTQTVSLNLSQDNYSGLNFSLSEKVQFSLTSDQITGLQFDQILISGFSDESDLITGLQFGLGSTSSVDFNLSSSIINGLAFNTAQIVGFTQSVDNYSGLNFNQTSANQFALGTDLIIGLGASYTQQSPFDLGQDLYTGNQFTVEQGTSVNFNSGYDQFAGLSFDQNAVTQLLLGQDLLTGNQFDTSATESINFNLGYNQYSSLNFSLTDITNFGLSTDEFAGLNYSSAEQLEFNIAQDIYSGLDFDITALSAFNPSNDYYIGLEFALIQDEVIHFNLGSDYFSGLNFALDLAYSKTINLSATIIRNRRQNVTAKTAHRLRVEL